MNFFNSIYILGYIDYVYISGNRLFIKLKFKNGYPVIKKVSFFSKAGQLLHLSHKRLFGIYSQNNITPLFFSSKFSYLNSDSIIKKIRSGGIAFVIITIL
ncbi:hypothetical protein AB834_03805 [PVC group bacterium (ex Bugula neritina AB1)]|nr:hypothetical protein AB834_03805 [PVC group bacterium (ex Bugula neritina AB1)]